MSIPINKTISKTTYTTFALLGKFCSHSTDPGDINAALGHLKAPSLSTVGQKLPSKDLRETSGDD